MSKDYWFDKPCQVAGCESKATHQMTSHKTGRSFRFCTVHWEQDQDRLVDLYRNGALR